MGNERAFHRRRSAAASIETLPDKGALMDGAADHFVRVASEAFSENGIFSVALSGGSTPRPLYALLAEERFARCVDWPHVYVFWGDERCVPPDDPRSNYRMARESLLDTVPLSPANIHRIHGEEDPKSAAAAYEEELRAFFGSDATNSFPRRGFDLVLLGMGEDGHTASLFPGSPAVTERVRWVMAQHVEAVSMWRITFTPVFINAARNIFFIISGGAKAERLREVLEGQMQPGVLPAQSIHPTHGRLLWLLDQAAARLLKKA